jgi:cytoskeletal protein CcmA (bactofilin family)
VPGSTLGRQIHVDGTIVCDEDLTILGRVDGTIRAQGTLVIAKEADVRAKIDGERVLVHGKVDGNVNGAERVVLGQTARLTGNIQATVLEIAEGAYFKGNVEMQSPKPAKESAKAADGKLKAADDAAKASDDREKEGESSAAGAETANVKPLAGPPADEVAATQKQATS